MYFILSFHISEVDRSKPDIACNALRDLNWLDSYLQAIFTDAIFTDVSRRCQQAGVDQDKLVAELFCHIFFTIGNLQGVRCFAQN